MLYSARMISTPSENEDVDFEPEDELRETGAVKAKMQKLREELKEAKAKRGTTSIKHGEAASRASKAKSKVF